MLERVKFFFHFLSFTFHDALTRYICIWKLKHNIYKQNEKYFFYEKKGYFYQPAYIFCISKYSVSIPCIWINNDNEQCSHFIVHMQTFFSFWLLHLCRIKWKKPFLFIHNQKKFLYNIRRHVAILIVLLDNYVCQLLRTFGPPLKLNSFGHHKDF